MWMKMKKVRRWSSSYSKVLRERRLVKEKHLKKEDEDNDDDDD